MQRFNFKVDTQKLDDGTILLSLYGSLDAFTFEKLDSIAHEKLSGYDIKAIIDLEGLEHISSAGAGTLISITETVVSKNGGVVICNIPEDVKKVFNILGIEGEEPFQNRQLTFAADREAAGMLLQTI